MNTKHFLKLASASLWGNGQVPDNYYLGLSTTTPSEDGTGYTEPTDASYARMAIPNDGTSFTAPDEDAVVTNAKSISFPPTTVNGSPVTDYLVFDAPQGGNLLFSNKLENPRSMEVDTVINFPVGNIKLQAVNTAT